MPILHPVFLLIIAALIAFSFLEVYGKEYRNFKAVWILVAALVILAGLRYWVGADYPAYNNIFKYYGEFGNYQDIWDKALFRDTDMELEWLWVLIGKIYYALAIPFHYYVLLIAIFSISLKYMAFEQAAVYPALSMLLYLFPSYFSGDMGQMRQALAMGILLYSFVFIKKRNLPMFLLMVYLAMGFHKSSVIFLPAYWIAVLNLTPRRMIIVLVLCMILSPFQIYNFVEVLSAIAPADVYAGFSDYSMTETEDPAKVTFTDLLVVMYMFFLLTFNREACEKIPYYEYMRNIGFVGLCIFYIFRMSPIFSSRLTAVYLVYMVMVLPNIVAAFPNLNYRKYLHFILISFVVFYCFVYTSRFAERAGFTIERYQNHLWVR